MSAQRHPPTEPARQGRRFRRTAAALRRRFTALVGRVVAPLGTAWPWWRRLSVEVGADDAEIEVTLAVEPGSAAHVVPVAATPSRTRAETARQSTDCIVLTEAEVIQVEVEFSEPQYAALLDLLQRGPRSKVLDLRPARALKLGLFRRLADDWTAPGGTVSHVGIVLGFEQWTVLHNVAARRLHPLADRGVAVELFYPQQIDSLPGWFTGRGVRHDHLPEVIAWLRTEWRPGPIWPAVLRATQSVIQTSAELAAVPDMLLELAAIARSFPAPEGPAQAAHHARAALSWIGDELSPTRCRALRALAAAILPLGETEAGLALLQTAITNAAMLRDPIEEASALADLGFHALRRGHSARAEARFRAALELLSAADPAYLRAMLHHDLALALHLQGKDADEAEYHATTALRLRWDQGSQIAREDRALIALICARRASPRAQTSSRLLGQLSRNSCAPRSNKNSRV
jgi:tetratricopeptide (TPR) repeat protein